MYIPFVFFPLFFPLSFFSGRTWEEGVRGAIQVRFFTRGDQAGGINNYLRRQLRLKIQEVQNRARQNGNKEQNKRGIKAELFRQEGQGASGPPSPEVCWLLYKQGIKGVVERWGSSGRRGLCCRGVVYISR